MDREAWHAAVHGVAKSRTWLSGWTELKQEQCGGRFCLQTEAEQWMLPLSLKLNLFSLYRNYPQIIWRNSTIVHEFWGKKTQRCLGQTKNTLMDKNWRIFTGKEGEKRRREEFLWVTNFPPEVEFLFFFSPKNFIALLNISYIFSLAHMKLLFLNNLK